MPQSKRKPFYIIIPVIILVLVFSYLKINNALPHNSSKWQAVFLSDGQVYFGKLSNYNNKFALLDRVYYLKFAQGLQEGGANAIASQQLNLIKLGGEAHGPENQMYL